MRGTRLAYAQGCPGHGAASLPRGGRRAATESRHGGEPVGSGTGVLGSWRAPPSCSRPGCCVAASSGPLDRLDLVGFRLSVAFCQRSSLAVSGEEPVVGWTEAGLSSDGRLAWKRRPLCALPGSRTAVRGQRPPTPRGHRAAGAQAGGAATGPCSADGPELLLPSAVRRAGLGAGSLLGGRWGAPAGSAVGTPCHLLKGPKSPGDRRNSPSSRVLWGFCRLQAASAGGGFAGPWPRAWDRSQPVGPAPALQACGLESPWLHPGSSGKSLGVGHVGDGHCSGSLGAAFDVG